MTQTSTTDFSEARDNDSALGPLRVLDLTEGGVMLGARMLGDMGADVIKIEPPGGSPSRLPPFYQDIPHPEKSLFWFAYNANKRGITLDINHTEGQELFRRLVATADIVMESFPPGHMAAVGLDYDRLCKIKPDLIMAAITPFGQDGPKATYQASDLTAWASGGYLYICGNPDRAPTWISFPQAGLFGGAEAAVGTLTALWHRQNTGEGQYVDVSVQECMLSPTMNTLPMWDANQVEFQRTGGAMYVPDRGVSLPLYYPCRDGFAIINLQGGNDPFAASSRRLAEWMAEEGMASDWLQKLDWRVDYDATVITQETTDRVGAEVEKFTLTKTKAELFEEGALKRGILIAPFYTTADITQDAQLQSRQYWREIPHPELGSDLTYVGPFARMSETPLTCRQRAPLIGEHNDDIYTGELGISKDKLAAWEKEGVI